MNVGTWRVVLHCVVLVSVILSATAKANQPAYTVDVLDVASNREYRLFHNGFHFGSLIVTDFGISNGLVLRPHPDLSAPDGWGSSLFLAPFLAGADSGGANVHLAWASPGGIVIVARGTVNAESGGEYGGWVFSISLRYDPQTETISSVNGWLRVALDGPLVNADRDLNLFKLSTNYLHNVPLQSGGFGDTGDISVVNYRYGPFPDPRDFTWIPPLLPAHFPFDLTRFLSVEAVGTINDVDTLALGEGFQINVAPKPTLEVTLTALRPGYQMIAGMIWDTEQSMNFAADNVGVTPLVPKGTTNATELVFGVNFRSTPPPE